MPPQRGGRPRNHTVESAFRNVILHGRLAPKTPTVECIHCQKQMAKGTSRQQQHLDFHCTRYKIHMASSITKQEEEGEKPHIQSTLTARHVCPAEQVLRLHRTAAMACYMTNLPFNHWEDPYVRDHERQLHAGYVPPSHAQLAGPLLEWAYSTVKEKVDRILRASDLNFFTDETTNIRKERVINFCCHVPKSATATGGGFHLKAEVGIARIIDGELQARWLHEQLVSTTGGELWRVNSVATDTCDTMRKVARLLAKLPGMQHVFFVGCDSHGLQLLLKDIIDKPFFKSVLKKAQRIAVCFLASPKELSILWEYMEQAYGKRRALILSCPTRWGTTVGLLTAIWRNQQAFMSYAAQIRPGIDHQKDKKHVPICPILKDTQFWADLTTAKDLLDPIHRIQYTSESESYPLYRVCSNWNDIRAHLMKKAQQHPHITDLKDLANKTWDDRYLRQVQPINVVAALLWPKRWNCTVVGVTTRPAFMQVMHDFFASYLSTLEERTQALKQWSDFRAQANGFASDSICWTYIDDPDLFWATAEAMAPQLSRLARRVMKLPGNSVLAERDWSVMNLIKSKTRNSLRNVHVDKLMYIYMNERTLHRPHKQKKRLQYTQGLMFDDDDLVEMEERLLAEETYIHSLNQEHDDAVTSQVDEAIFDPIAIQQQQLWGQQHGSWAMEYGQYQWTNQEAAN